MRVGLLGVGHIADQYVAGMAMFDNLELVAVADTNAELCDQRARQWSVRGREPDALLIDGAQASWSPWRRARSTSPYLEIYGEDASLSLVDPDVFDGSPLIGNEFSGAGCQTAGRALPTKAARSTSWSI